MLNFIARGKAAKLAVETAALNRKRGPFFFNKERFVTVSKKPNKKSMVRKNHIVCYLSVNNLLIRHFDHLKKCSIQRF